MENDHDIERSANRIDHPDNFPLWCVALIASALGFMTILGGVVILYFCILPALKTIFGG